MRLKVRGRSAPFMIVCALVLGVGAQFSPTSYAGHSDDEKVCDGKSEVAEETTGTLTSFSQNNIELGERARQQQRVLLERRIAKARRYPPVSLADTTANGLSAHGQVDFIATEKIKELHKPVKAKRFNDRQTGLSLKIYFNENGKPIIQQQATRGCTAAVAAMLIMENGGRISAYDVCRRNLGDDHSMISDIKAGGDHLHPIVTELDDLRDKGRNEKLEYLRRALIEQGSAIASVDGEGGGHVLVVDQVSEDLSTVRLRDPYHGWDISIEADAFLDIWSLGRIIQVRKE